MGFPTSWSGTVSARGVTVAQALERLEAGLEDEAAEDVQREGRSIQFRGGVFLGLRRRSVLRAISSGVVKVSYTATGVEIGYCLRLTPFLVNASVVLAFLGVPILMSTPIPVGIAVVTFFTLIVGVGYSLTLSWWSSLLRRWASEPGPATSGWTGSATAGSRWMNRALPLGIAIIALGGLAGVLGLIHYDESNESRTRQELLDNLADTTAARLNGHLVDDPSIVVRKLRLVAHVPPHHSSPAAPIRIELIRRNETATVVIARDSSRPDEFLVFLPGQDLHRNPLGRMAGRVTSRELDEFLKAGGL